jgi:Fe-S oxidoreductase
MLGGRRPSETELWRCLTCGLCKERCPSDVDFPRFINRLREFAFAEGTLPEDTHGGTIKQLMRMMGNEELRQSKTDWLPGWVKQVEGGSGEDAGEGSEVHEDVYFVGCAPYFDVIFEDFELDLTGTHKAGLEILKTCGVYPAVLRDERCCGHDALWSGDRELFLKLARQNVEMLRRVGAKRVFVSCPEGYHTLAVEYPEHLGDTGFEVINTVKFIAENCYAGIDQASAALGAGAKSGSKAKDAAGDGAGPDGDLEITYHDSCRMGRFSGLYEEPRQMLESVEGVSLKEMEFTREQAPCCGSNLWINCDALSKQMQMDLIKEAEKSGARLMLTACDKCRIHLACALMQNGKVANGIKTENILRFVHRNLQGEGVRKSK